MNKAITAIDVSNYFINQSIENDMFLSGNRILILVCIAQGYNLALENKELFPEDCLAWKCAILIEKANEHVSKVISNNVLRKRQKFDIFLFNKRQIEIMHVVFRKYSQMYFWAVTNLLHKKGSPWDDCCSKDQINIIPKQMIKEYFEEIVTDESFVLLLSEAQSKTSYRSDKEMVLKKQIEDLRKIATNLEKIISEKYRI